MSHFISLNENPSNIQLKVPLKILDETVQDFMIFLLGKN